MLDSELTSTLLQYGSLADQNVCRGVFKGSKGFRDLNEGKPVSYGNDGAVVLSSRGTC